jgi:hypothetical protein
MRALLKKAGKTMGHGTGSSRHNDTNVDWLQTVGFESEFLEAERRLGLQKGQDFNQEQKSHQETLLELYNGIGDAADQSLGWGKQNTLPAGSERSQHKDYEEVWIPPPKNDGGGEHDKLVCVCVCARLSLSVLFLFRVLSLFLFLTFLLTDSDLAMACFVCGVVKVNVDELDDYAQLVFEGTKQLNRMQSRVSCLHAHMSLCCSHRSKTKEHNTAQGKTRQDKTRQDKTRQDKHKHNTRLSLRMRCCVCVMMDDVTFGGVFSGV